MVLKLDTNTCEPSNVFENDVKMYGTQTEYYPDVFTDLFENDVKMYGTQTFRSKSVRN